MGSNLRFALTCATAVLGVMTAFGLRAESPGPEALPQDDIVLTLSHGPSTSQVILSWTGGLPIFTVFRSVTVPVLINPGNQLGSTNSPGWFDVPPTGEVFYYEIRGTGCASDAGCPTGHCADSYCCDAACTGICQACDLAGAEGSCLPPARGDDPDGDCGAQGRCDGSGGCLLIDGAICTVPAQCLSALCTIFFRDSDGDGFGTPGGFVAACGTAPPTGYASNFTDCDDSNAFVHPGGPEYAGDEIDGDCDGTEVCFLDADDDGFLGGQTVMSSDIDCADPGEGGFTETGGDCCDETSLVHPGQTQFFSTASPCGHFDYNCDGIPTQQFNEISTTTSACGGSPPLCIDFGTGWVSSIPFCGMSATYRDCSSTCGTITFPFTQRCR